MKRTIQTPTIKIKTRKGTFNLVVETNDRVQLSGNFALDGVDFPFKIRLNRSKSPAWELAEITGMQNFFGEVVTAFAEWAGSHPRIFLLSSRIQEHNLAEAVKNPPPCVPANRLRKKANR